LRPKSYCAPDHFLTKTLQFVNLATNQFTGATVALYWEPYKHNKARGTTMNKPTIAQIKKSVKANGGEMYKVSAKINGNDAYRVNGRLYTKPQLIEAAMIGTI
jgi:hypothetical protein